ncbi:MAG: hypothetical protein EOO40_13100 [Deltaproteobacteria bacterium]|nr:MAG: hypothetical protein EOO40_13100 [Deltaproteobacteria bacterium]
MVASGLGVRWNERELTREWRARRAWVRQAAGSQAAYPQLATQQAHRGANAAADELRMQQAVNRVAHNGLARTHGTLGDRNVVPGDHAPRAEAADCDA